MVAKKNFIVCFVGLPASGKTTFVRVLKGSIEKKFNTKKVKVIDPDIIRKLITSSKFNYKFEPKVREKNLSEIRENLQEGYIVISDDLNYYTSMRHDLKKLSDEFNIPFFIIFISTPIEICLKWNNSRGNPIPNKIIKKINKKFDNFGRYKWDTPDAIYDISQVQDLDKEADDLVEVFDKKLRIPKEFTEQENKLKNIINKNNEYLDKTTREYIGKILDDSTFLSMKKNILKARKLFVKLYKNRSLKYNEIIILFKDYLEKRLNIIISEDLF